MIARIATFGWLVAVWLVLVESVTPGAFLAAIVVASLLMASFRPPTADVGSVRIRPVGLAVYVVRFLASLVWANVQVAWAVIAPERAGVNRAVIRLPVAEMPDTATMVLANAISLTPGTFILEIRSDPSVFYVHVLQLSSVEDVHHDLWTLQRRLTRALGLATAEATLDAWLAGTEEPPAPTGGRTVDPTSGGGEAP